MKKILPAFLAIIVALLSQTTFAQAETIHLEVSGNGEGSVNEVSSESSTETSIEQSNEANISNDVDIDSNTGENQASGNTGEQTEISTGDVANEVLVTNQTNTSSVQTECCDQTNTELIIQNNGDSSINTIESSSTQTTEVSVNQEATITNNINGTSNTGNNQANNNSGDVEINTGNIETSSFVSNSGNDSILDLGSGATFGDQIVIISSNGSGSTNKIVLNFNDSLSIKKHNSSNIINNVYWLANTGGNTANGNLGSVSIRTGDIDLSVQVINGPINIGGISVGGCCNEDPADPFDPPTPTPAPSPTPPGPTNGGGGNSGNGNSDGGSNGNSNGGNGKSGGDVLGIGGAVLPATGSDWMLLLLANVLMFLMGLYLRLRSGRSPTMIFTTKGK